MRWMESNTEALPNVQALLTLMTLMYIWWCPHTWVEWVGSVLLYACIGCFGISVGYHRLLTHKSFKTSKFWEYFCSLWGTLAFTGSPLGWVVVHRDHHKYSDTIQDPHSPHHLSYKMLMANYKYEANKWKVRDFIGSKFHMLVHRYYFGGLAVWSLLWLVTFGISGLMHVVVIPAVISIWVSTSSNYMNHKWGYRTFKTDDRSKNNWFNALYTFGEGWHNNHHAYPGRWNFGVQWWELDVGSLFIRMIKHETVSSKH